MAADPPKISKRTFVYNIEILIEDETNGRALEKLLRVLNRSEITDYRIQSGIECTYIQEALEQNPVKTPLEHLPSRRTKEEPAKTANDGQDAHHTIWEQLQQYKTNNVLVRMTIIKPMGVKLSIPGRILNVDPPSGNVSVYHVDEKQVYLFNIHEIDDFSIG